MSLESVNLNLLLSLKALLDEANVTRAAKRLNITQSAMSKNLAQLRDLFADKLLVRVGNRLVLTERGIELRAGVGAVLKDIGSLIEGDVFNPETCGSLFRIATTDYVAERVLPDALAAMTDEAPNIRVAVSMWSQGDVYRLADGSLDFVSCIMDETVEGLRSDSIGTDRFACCMRKGHPLETNLDFESYCLADHGTVTGGGDKVRPVDEYLFRKGRSRRISFSAPLFGAVLEVVKRSDILLTIPAHIAHTLSDQYNLRVVALPFDLPEFEYSLFWHESRDTDSSHAWFRKRLISEIRRFSSNRP